MPVGRGRGYNGSIPDILALTAWSYRSGLIKAYTLPYLDRIRAQLAPGSRIALVTLEQDGFALDEEARRREQARLASRGVDWIPLPYARFGLRALWNAALGIARLAFLCRRRRIADLHCFGTPAGAQGYALSILTGARLVLDSYEPHAEAMVETGTWTRTSLAFRILFPLERLQSRRARAVIAVSEGMRDYARSRYGVEFSRFFVKPACVDLELFKRDELEAARLRKALGLEGAVACVYAGKTGGIYLERELFDFFKAARDYWGERFRALVLSSDPEDSLRRLAERSGFPGDALIVRFVDHDAVPAHLAAADFAVTPVKPVPTKRCCTPIKDGEYWAMGLPVVITPGISEDSEIIRRRGIGAVLEGFAPEHYRAALRRIDELLREVPPDELRARIRATAVEFRGFERADAAYRGVYGKGAG